MPPYYENVIKKYGNTNGNRLISNDRTDKVINTLIFTSIAAPIIVGVIFRVIDHYTEKRKKQR